jgi:hypothetical protein
MHQTRTTSIEEPLEEVAHRGPARFQVGRARRHPRLAGAGGRAAVEPADILGEHLVRPVLVRGVRMESPQVLDAPDPTVGLPARGVPVRQKLGVHQVSDLVTDQEVHRLTRQGPDTG